MTNREKILNKFPNITTRVVTNASFKYVQLEQNDKWIADFNIDWWNAEYKEPTTQERQAESDKFDAAFQDGYDHGYAQARFDYEQEAYNKGYADGVKSVNICPHCGEYIGEEE